MNDLIQNILAFAALAFALTFLIRKFFFRKSKAKKGIDSAHDCDNCH